MDEQPDGRESDRDTHDAAERGQRQAFPQQLADDLARAGAEGGLHRQLLLPRLGPHEQQVGDVGARDQQDHADRPHQHPERALDVADEVVLERADLGRQARLLEHRQRGAGERREFAQGHRDHPRDVGAGPLDRFARLQPGNPRVAEHADHGLAAIETERDDQRDVAIEETERVGQDADDLARLAVEGHGTPDRRRVGPELRPPVAGGEDHGLGAAGRVVGPGEHPADHRLDAEDRQQAVGREQRRHFFRLSDAGDADGTRPPHRDVLEDPPLFAIGEVEERGGPGPRDVEAGRGVIERDNRLRPRIRQRLQQDAGDDAEDGGVGADAEAKGQHGHSREQGHGREAADDVSPAHGGTTRGGGPAGAPRCTRRPAPRQQLDGTAPSGVASLFRGAESVRYPARPPIGALRMRKTTGYVRVVVVSGLAWMAAIGIGVAQTTRVSTDAVGAQVAGASRQPSASADGRFVAFSSTATTLVAGDTNGSADIFVKDRQTGAVTRVSVRTGGAEFVGDSVSPDISADGRYVTFVSAAFLTADDTNTSSCPGANVTGPSCPDVFRHDRITGETIRLSVSSAGVQADAASAAPRISGDGRFVVYESAGHDAGRLRQQPRRDIFLRDAQTATTTRMSVATGGAQSDRDASAPSISDDGSRVSFLSDATTLDASADPLACDAAVLPCTRVFVRTVAGATTTRLGFTVSLPGVSGVVAEAHRVRERHRRQWSVGGHPRLRPGDHRVGPVQRRCLPRLLVRAGRADRRGRDRLHGGRPRTTAQQRRGRRGRPRPRLLRGRGLGVRGPGLRHADMGGGRQPARPAGLRGRLAQRRWPHAVLRLIGPGRRSRATPTRRSTSSRRTSTATTTACRAGGKTSSA